MANVTASPWQFSWITTEETDADYSLNAIAYDQASNSKNSSAIDVRVDNTKPSPSITSHIAGEDVNGTVRVTATITEAGSGLQYVDLYVDGAYEQRNSTPGTTTTFDWDSTSVGDDTHMLSVRAYDFAGNYNDSAGVGVDVFNQPPISVVITSPANNTYHNGTIKIIASASANVNISSVEFYNGTISLIGAADTDGSDGWSTSWDTSDAADGWHNLTAKAYTNVNKVLTSIAITILVDNTVPLHLHSTIQAHTSQSTLSHGTGLLLRTEKARE